MSTRSAYGTHQPVALLVHFDDTGAATDNNAIGVLDEVTWTAAETESGGASTKSYDCVLTYGADDPTHLSVCTGGNQAVTFGNDVLTDQATITVTNTFEAPTTTTTKRRHVRPFHRFAICS